MNDETLKEQILKEFKQVHKLAPADYTENCTNVVMSIIKEDRERAVREARINEWKLISESLHSAWLTASNFLSESRNRRLNELRGESDE